MSRPKSITYPILAQHCAELIAQGEQPSVRKLHQRLGGSFSTLSELYQHWRSEQVLAAQTEGDLSESFHQAVLAEIGRATEVLRQNLTQQLVAERAQLKETQGLLAELEAKNEELIRQFDELQQSSEQTKLGLEKALAAARALVEDSQQRQAAYQQEIEALRNQAHAAELKVAISETRCQELLKQNERLEQENQRLVKK